MMQGQYQYDGVPLDVGGEYVQANSFSGDMAFYDRVEVLKGAAGMLKGSGSSTGGVNFVRKRGQSVPETKLSLSAGSWDNYRGQVDTGGPLNESGSCAGGQSWHCRTASIFTMSASAMTRFSTARWTTT